MKTFAIVGAGYRGLYMFGIRLIEEQYRDKARLVAICDPNPVRMDYFESETVPLQKFTDFTLMLETVKPDTVIVCSTDASHDEYIIEALDFGSDVLSEKPMTTDAAKARRIQEAEARNNRQVQVVFNMRYMPLSVALKEVFVSEALGEITSVSLDWYLDRSHGADYFRRWHRIMEQSGGLLVHKSTHHFDLVNWFLDDLPETIYARGDLAFYGPKREERSERCLGCTYKDSCEFYWDIEEDPIYVGMYKDAEEVDGYIRDGCVFSPDINIYDTTHVQIAYRKGTLLNYSLVAYAPFEGWTLVANGTEGRLEMRCFTSGERAEEKADIIEIFYPNGETKRIEVVKLEGLHGGADDLMLKDIIEGGREDLLGQKAGSEDGVYSLIIGASANESIVTGKPVRIEERL